MDVLNFKPIQAHPQYKVVMTPPLHLPLDLQDSQGSFQRTELEIGFGNGEFTVKNAQLNPNTLFWGIDVSASCMLRCARRAAGLPNLRIIRTDARYMMKELFQDNSLDTVRMNFPCPWPKRKQAHRRVTAKSFTDDLASVLKINGVFEMVTDDEPYAHEVHKVLGAHSALETLDFEINPVRPVTTKYERKWLAMGKSIFRLTFAKKCDFTTVRQTWPVDNGNNSYNNTEEIMHFKTATPPSVERIMALNGISGACITSNANSIGETDNESHWSFGHCCSIINNRADTSDASHAFLLEAFSSDDEFEQRYYIRISERDGGSLVQLDKTANAFLTPAVRASLADVAARLA